MEEQGKEEKKLSIELKNEEKERQDFSDRNSPGDGEKKKEQKRVAIILFLVFLMAALSFFLPKAYAKKDARKVQILKNGIVLIEKNLSENSKILIMDNEAREVDFKENLASLSDDEVNPAKHEVIFIEIKDGKVLCTESNCNNQICVHTPAISEENQDLPIVCLPHGLIIQIITKS
nr:NusG domain II-containing protein [uncultured Oribacterium sp.]